MSKIYPVVFYWWKIKLCYWKKPYWYLTLKSQILTVKQILQFPWLDLIFIKIFFTVKIIMSSRQFAFSWINKIQNYANILTISFCQYKMSLFKFICSGLFFVRLRGGSVQIPFFHLEISQTESVSKVILFTVTLLSLMYILPILFEKIFLKDHN